MGVRSLAASIVNVTVGGGIFILPSIVAAGLGAAAWMAYVVCAIAFGLIVLCFAEAGSRVRLTGGAYAYVGRVFGPFVGYISGVLLALLGVIAHASIANGFTKALTAMLPAIGGGAGRAMVIVGVFAVLAWVNARGVKQGTRLIEVATVAKLLPLAVFVLVGAFAMNGGNLVQPEMPTIGDLGRMSILLVFAFSGVESALTPSGEVKDPARTVPRAIALAMIGITVLYIVVQLVAQGILGPELATSTDGTLAVAAGKAMGPAGRWLLLIGAVVSMFGYMSGMMLAMPRTLYAFARDGYLPRALAKVDAQTRVPVVAIGVYFVVVSALAVSGSFESLAILSNISALLLYLLCSLAAFQLRRLDVQEGGGTPFRIPGGAIIPWLSVAVILFLLSNATMKELTAIGTALAISAVVYLFRRPPLPSEAGN